MDTEEALREATKFLDEFPRASFPTDEALVAAAMLWGEHLGITHTRSVAIRALADARAELFS